MLNFEYYTPTRVVFGKGTEERVGELILREGCRKVLVHYGGGSVKRSGLLDKVYGALDQAGVEFVSLGGVVPNPRLSLVYEGIKLCREEGVDFILAVGGGSVIDSAKAIGYGAVHDFDVWDLYDRKARATGCLPIGSVLTIAAAGSEMSASSVITKDEGGIKRGYSSDYSRCRFAVMNPELTYTVTPYQTACGIVDILMHTMERYFTQVEHTELTDSIAEGLMRTVIAQAPVVMNAPDDYNARAQLMWAGSLSHNDLTGAGTEGDWSCHQMEHELSGMFDVAHGAGLAAIWGSWARYVYQSGVERFAQFAINVMGMRKRADKKAVALRGIRAMEDFYRSIGMPVSIGELGVDLTEEQVDELARKCSFDGTRTLGHFRVLDEADMKAVYKAAR